MVSDAQKASRLLCEQSGVGKLVLVGVCSGGEVALGAGATIAECDAMVLWSVPQVAADRVHADRAKRKAIFREYWSKLFRAETWRKLAGGALNFGMIRKAILRGGKGEGEESAPEDKDIDWRGRFIEFRGAIFYIYGTNDPTTPDCTAHYEALSKQAGRTFHCHLIEGANHSFYSLEWEAEVLDKSLAWLDERYPAPPAREAPTAAGPMPFAIVSGEIVPLAKAVTRLRDTAPHLAALFDDNAKLDYGKLSHPEYLAIRTHSPALVHLGPIGKRW